MITLNNLECGTYQGCSFCKEVPDCCSDFNRMDNPILSKEEICAIEDNTEEIGFYEQKMNGSYMLKTTRDGQCVFFLDKGCAIYKYRPADCKLYPYDIIKESDGYYLILYTLGCISEKYFSSPEEVERIMPVVQSVLPWIDEFTDEGNYSKMSDMPYKVLKKVK